jgi:hypothetical protein
MNHAALSLQCFREGLCTVTDAGLQMQTHDVQSGAAVCLRESCCCPGILKSTPRGLAACD